MTDTSSKNSESSVATTMAWVGPFAVFMLWLLVDKYIPLANPAKEIARDLVILGSIIGFSRRVIPRSAPHWMASIVLGVAVCAMWVAPDAIFPGWRDFWLFQNGITGHLKTSIPRQELTP